uniref:Uncharacterized protein n=1 Tax=Heterorhabditis bacteriophora TaxID=37862 RepID=A0A1I7WDR0_HETBA
MYQPSFLFKLIKIKLSYFFSLRPIITKHLNIENKHGLFQNIMTKNVVEGKKRRLKSLSYYKNVNLTR